jgi:hypothetical protein
MYPTPNPQKNNYKYWGISWLNLPDKLLAHQLEQDINLDVITLFSFSSPPLGLQHLNSRSMMHRYRSPYTAPPFITTKLHSNAIEPPPTTTTKLRVSTSKAWCVMCWYSYSEDVCQHCCLHFKYMLHHLQHNRINLIYHNDNATKQELFLCVRITSQSQSFGLTTILILQQSCLVRDSSRKPLFNFNSKRQLESNLWCDCNTWIQIQMSYCAPDKTEVCCTLYVNFILLPLSLSLGLLCDGRYICKDFWQ